MKKIYLVTLALLTSLACNTIKPMQQITPAQRALQHQAVAQQLLATAPMPSQREFAKEALALQFSAGPVLAPTSPLIAYSTQRGNYKFSFWGYIKTDIFWDSWQVRAATQDQVLLFPEEPVFDRCGRDINHKGRFNMLAIETRLRLEIEGPSAFGARTFGVIEPDFRGGDLVALAGIAHLVHGHIYLDWGHKSLLIGQYFHPVFPAEYKCFARPVSYNYGLPFDPYALEPQIRFTKQYGIMSYQVTFLSHSYRFYGGPSGRSSLYSRNAIMPNMNFLSVATIRKHRLGIGFDMTRLVPRLRTNLALPASQSFKTSESLISFLGHIFLVLDFEAIDIRSQLIWAQNGAGYAMFTGYGVQCFDPLTDVRKWANTQQVTIWTDVQFKNFLPFEPGFFFGLSKNLGAGTRITPFIGGVEQVFTPGNRHHMDYLLRFSPRLRWYARPFVLGTELEFTRALWGKIDDHARVVNASPVNNLRLLFGAYYYY